MLEMMETWDDASLRKAVEELVFWFYPDTDHTRSRGATLEEIVDPISIVLAKSQWVWSVLLQQEWTILWSRGSLYYTAYAIPMTFLYTWAPSEFRENRDFAISFVKSVPLGFPATHEKFQADPEMLLIVMSSQGVLEHLFFHEDIMMNVASEDFDDLYRKIVVQNETLLLFRRVMLPHLLQSPRCRGFVPFQILLVLLTTRQFGHIYALHGSKMLLYNNPSQSDFP